MLEGYGLTTAEILYPIPDYPDILQTYVWQEYDLFPHFPELRKFMRFWKRKLISQPILVRVAHSHLITPAEIRATEHLRLH